MKHAITACHVYRARKVADMYVYLAERDGFDVLPAGLKARTGPLDHAMSLELTPDRKLARADAAAVIQALQEQGYYVQLPPPRNTLMPNDRLPG